MAEECKSAKCLVVDPHITQVFDVACACVIILIMIISTIGSVLFLMTLYRLMSRRLSSHIFMLSLILTDLLVALCSMPISIAILFNLRTMPNTPSLKSNIYVQGFSHFISRQASLGTMCLIVIDRLIAIKRPFRYKQVVTIKVAVSCTLIVWFIAIMTSLWPWFERLNPCHDSDPVFKKAALPYSFLPEGLFIYASWFPTCDWTPPKYGYYIFIPTFVVTLILVTSLTIFLGVKLMIVKTNIKGKEKNFRQATVTTLYVSLMFLFCYTLRHMYPIITKSCKLSCETKGMIAAAMTTVIYLNSAANPIIYLARGKMLKKEALNMLSTAGQDFKGVMSGIFDDISRMENPKNGESDKFYQQQRRKMYANNNNNHELVDEFSTSKHQPTDKNTSDNAASKLNESDVDSKEDKGKKTIQFGGLVRNKNFVEKSSS